METQASKRGRTPKHTFSTGLVERFENELTPAHFAILMAITNGGYAGASAALSIPVGTCKSRLNRARAALAAILSCETHPNGAPKWAPDGMMLNEDGTRSTFDDVDE